MTKNEFRLKYSELIEYYQYIEMRLKGICAEYLTDKEENWYSKFVDYQPDPFGCLINKLREIQNNIKDPILTQKDIQELDEIRKERNYWVHECFGGLKPIIFNRNDEIKNDENATRLNKALRAAVEWDEKLAETGRKIRGGRSPRIDL